MRGASPWLPDGFQPPARLDLPTGHHLRPIRAADLDLDHPTVMGSQERLWSIFGKAWGWPPPTMTREEDEADLARHEAEIAARESFNYAVLDEHETELLGCVHVDPPFKRGAEADVCWWVVDPEVDGPLDVLLAEAVPAWIASTWPFADARYPGQELSWDDWLALPDADDAAA